jgi:hypothetical protein
MVAWSAGTRRRTTTRRAVRAGGGGGGRRGEVARVGSGLGLVVGAGRGRVGASRSHLSRRSRSARRRIEVKRRGRGGRREEDQERATAYRRWPANTNPPRSAPRANRMATSQRQRALAQAGPAVRRAVQPASHVPTVPACSGYSCRLQLPRPRAPRGTVEWLSPSRARRTRASHMGTGGVGRGQRFATLPSCACVSSQLVFAAELCAAGSGVLVATSLPETRVHYQGG